MPPESLIIKPYFLYFFTRIRNKNKKIKPFYTTKRARNANLKKKIIYIAQIGRKGSGRKKKFADPSPKHFPLFNPKSNPRVLFLIYFRFYFIFMRTASKLVSLSRRRDNTWPGKISGGVFLMKQQSVFSATPF